MPDGFSSPYDNCTFTYTLKGQNLISSECGDWHSYQSLERYIKEDLTIDEKIHHSIKKNKKAN